MNRIKPCWFSHKKFKNNTHNQLLNATRIQPLPLVPRPGKRITYKKFLYWKVYWQHGNLRTWQKNFQERVARLLVKTMRKIEPKYFHTPYLISYRKNYGDDVPYYFWCHLQGSHMIKHWSGLCQFWEKFKLNVSFFMCIV